MGQYYRLDRLLSKKDINGNTPEIYIVAGNRTAGKTFAIKEFMLCDFLKNGHQFMLQFRKNYDISDCEKSFMDDLRDLFPDYDMHAESERRGAYKVLYSGVYNRFMDEFQSENGDYIDREISKYMSIHYSIARGYEKQYRYVREFLASNTFTKYNPYYIALGISDRLEHNSKFVRGDGWVLEITNNDNARELMLSSGFSKAFGGTSYVQSAAKNKHILDNDAFVSAENTRGMLYWGTIVFYNDESDAPDKIAVYVGQNKCYVCSKVNSEYKRVITFNPRTHTEDTLLTSDNAELIRFFRDSFDRGFMYFESGKIKKIVLDIMRYS